MRRSGEIHWLEDNVSLAITIWGFEFVRTLPWWVSDRRFSAMAGRAMVRHNRSRTRSITLDHVTSRWVTFALRQNCDSFFVSIELSKRILRIRAFNFTC